MHTLISGIHHITGIAGNPQKNIDFYTGILGLRLVKKTVNFDASGVYHFYYGNEKGDPGTILTFFPFEGARKGKKGTGEVAFTSFSIPSDAMDYWLERLKKNNIPSSSPIKRFTETLIRFEDFDGTALELVSSDLDNRNGWTYGNVPREFAIRGFHSATLNLRSKGPTADLLTGLMGYRFLLKEGNRFRYIKKDKPGYIVDILEDKEGEFSRQSAGSVHHIAFRTPNKESQQEILKTLIKQGFQVTEIKDRFYFKSIYFREPGGILFEVATDEPGFAIDEDVSHLGEALKLPPWAEQNRLTIEGQLPKVELRT